MERLRWPDGFICPQCGSGGGKNKRELWRCSACHRQFSMTAGTIFDGGRLGPLAWIHACWRGQGQGRLQRARPPAPAGRPDLRDRMGDTPEAPVEMKRDGSAVETLPDGRPSSIARTILTARASSMATACRASPPRPSSAGANSTASVMRNVTTCGCCGG